MPANRSRTERWIDCLHQIHERGGGIEFSVKRPRECADVDSDHGPDLVWRVRIVALSDQEIVVERPSALGQPINVAHGVELIVVMSIGQNRWMFETVTVPGSMPKPEQIRLGSMGAAGVLHLAMPQRVERCRRREFYRVSTVGLQLPTLRAWPLLDPASALPAEVANRALILDMQAGHSRSASEGDEILPEVAPPFNATLVNLGGGGLGLLVDKSEASAVERSKHVWVRFDLAPEIPAPLGVTAKIVHTHRDSEQNLYVGAAFDFSFHPAHREFVIAQMTRCVMLLQGRQRRAA